MVSLWCRGGKHADIAKILDRRFILTRTGRVRQTPAWISSWVISMKLASVTTRTKFVSQRAIGRLNGRLQGRLRADRFPGRK